MIENCLRHKIIRDFLRHYTENSWKELIPSLIEIAILNLQKSFNKLFFTNKELKKVLRHLQTSQIRKDKKVSKQKENENKDTIKDKETYKNINKGLNSINIDLIKEKENKANFDIKNFLKEKENEKENINFKNKLKLNDTPKSNINVGISNSTSIQRMKIIDLMTNNNLDKIKSCHETINDMKNNIKSTYQYLKKNISIDFKNNVSRKKYNHFKKINIDKNKFIQKKHFDKISYAISYDRDLRPENMSTKINKTNNTNNSIYNLKAKLDKDNYNSNYSKDKKTNSKSKSKEKKKKERYFNLNLNNINRINNMQNIKRRHYIFDKSNIKHEISPTGKIDKNNFFKKIFNNKNNKSKRYNSPLKEINNNYQVVKVDKLLMSRIKYKKFVNMKTSNSYNNYNYKNPNFINNLYQRMNMNGQAPKINNYFSNKDELEEFIKINKVNSKLNLKNDIISPNNLTKSERPIDRKNIFFNFDEKDKEKEKYNNSKRRNNNSRFSKDNSCRNKRKSNEKDKKNEFIKVNHIKDLIKINKIKNKTPKNSSINIERNSILTTESNIKDIKINKKTNNNEEEKSKKEEKNISISNSNSNNKNTGLKTIKLFDKNKIDFNKENNKNFEKVNGTYGDCRYINVFGYETEDLSLTQIEKDCSGMISSSTSNEIQMNPDYFLKESPKNIAKENKSENQNNNNSNDNKI